jgi:hypothetical protein
MSIVQNPGYSNINGVNFPNPLFSSRVGAIDGCVGSLNSPSALQGKEIYTFVKKGGKKITNKRTGSRKSRKGSRKLRKGSRKLRKGNRKMKGGYNPFPYGEGGNPYYSFYVKDFNPNTYYGSGYGPQSVGLNSSCGKPFKLLGGAKKTKNDEKKSRMQAKMKKTLKKQKTMRKKNRMQA